MSFYEEVLVEMQKLNRYIAQGFSITMVNEDLSGAWVELTSPDPSGDQVILHILTADARIHLGNLLMNQGLGA
ncbi:hypothetical protein E0485_12980 [Paenibacillus albiflavus]|uniref:Uncharacterized protein n=1 Tax=Paenibacillus albiflavus TaxID=2545760 RepID=A0A4V2WNR2_9BACL|nr:hypothetical protein [Paenibacillus albiflavus]TCZ76512.1 hypothetical protein E0485_12980 [Paenibacillus albiflavus]